MLIHHIVGRCWAVAPELAERVQQLLEAEGFAGLRKLAEFHRDVRAQADARAGSPRAGSRSSVNVAHIPVLGFITHRGDIVNSVESASSAAIADAARAAAADPAVDAILLEVDSPGGEVYGLAEAAAALREVRAVKPVVTHSNTHALSGGYWLLSQGDEIGVTLSGEVGSIGVFGAHEDKSKALEAAGRKVTLVSAGKYKTERNAYGPLSEEAHAAMQSDVDRYYGLFVADVAKGRRVPVDSVRSGYGEGRVVGAKSAVEQGMATFVGTLDEAFKRAASLGAEKRRSMSALAAAQGARAALSME